MTYCVKQGNDKKCSGTASTITVTNVAANETSVSICWVGIITEDDGCNKCETEQTYCEVIYIGENTSTTERPPIEGSIIWHGITIPYSITQNGKAVEPDCESATTISCITDNYNVWVSPYVIAKEDGRHDIKFYVDYSVATIDACGNVINIERVTSSGCPITGSAKTEFENAIINKECADTDRTISATCRLMDIVPCLTSDSAKTVSATCYLQEDENCCDNSGTSVCYEIGDIVYTPTSVPFSGGDVYYSFDYKKKTTTNCVTTTQIGSYTSTTPWTVPSGATDDCKRHQVTYSLPISSITSNSGDTQCRTNASAITLSIWQDKNINNPSCQTSSCTETAGIGYAIDTSSIKQYIYDALTDKWVYIGSGDTVHNFESYGAQVKVTWSYSSITIYDDCDVIIVSGNTWEDIKQIPPCDDCYNSNDPLSARTLSGYTDYVFKTKSKGREYSALTNSFRINYTQQKTQCVENCPSCLNDANITLESGYSARTDDSGNTIYEYSGLTPYTSYTSCAATLQTSSLPRWLSATTEDGYFVFIPKEANSGSTRSKGVTFDLGTIGGDSCRESINITQIGTGEERDPSDQEPELQCPCTIADGLFFGVASDGNVPYSGVTNKEIASIVYDNCLSGYDISLSASSSDFVSDFSASTFTPLEDGQGSISASVTTNCHCTDDRDIVLDIKYSGKTSTCTEQSGYTEVVKQNHYNCNCNKIVLADKEVSCLGGTSIEIGSYTASTDCCAPLSINGSTTSNFISNITGLSGDLTSTTVTTRTGKILADIKCNYCNENSRSDFVQFTYNVGVTKNCSASLLVTQKAGPKVTLTPSGEISNVGGNNIVIGSYTIDGEQPDTVSAKTDSSFISGLSASNGSISATVECNYCNTSSRVGMIDFIYKKGSCECTKPFSITQKAGPTVTITPQTNISYAGGSVTIGTYTPTNLNSVNASSSDSWIKSLAASNGNITATLDCNYCSGTSRVGTVKFTYGCSCEKIFTIVQNGGASAILIPNGEIPCGGGTALTLASYSIIGVAPTATSVSATSTDNFITDVGIVDNNLISGNVEANCCNESSREATITLTYSNGCECSKTCKITQKAGLNDKEIEVVSVNPDPITTSGGTLKLKIKNKE